MNCIICDEKINKLNHKIISCPYCSFEACRTCCEKYILDQNAPKCMSNACDKEWTRNQMALMFTKTFMSNEWKKHNEDILFEKEQALLPATQIIVEDIIRKEKINIQIMEINEKIEKLKIQQQDLRSTININNNENEKKVFVRACPDENCRGFLSTQWKCGLCEKYSCPECHVVKGIDRNIPHECDANELATAKLLDKDTKCCPKCSTGIFKIDGCDQMWCTICHTAFSWKTSKIETNIHNPHFYEWRRQNGTLNRNPGDGPCRQEINHNMIDDFFNILRIKEQIPKFNLKKDKDTLLPENANIIYNKLEFIIPRMIHFRYHDMPRYRMNQVENNLDLRIKFMRNMIDKEKFKITIQKQNKLFQKNHEIYQLLEVFNTTIIDILFRIKDIIELSQPKKIDYDLINNILNKEINNIISYVNDCFKMISSTYGSKLKKISISFDNKDEYQILF